MGKRRQRRSNTESFSDDELFREFEHNEEMRKLKLAGPKKSDFDIKPIQPMTENQKMVFEEYVAGNNLLLYGCAGTGKSFIPIYLSLRDVLQKRHEKLIIVRSAVPGRSLGFLPGTEEEKLEVYKLPYIQICYELFGQPDAYSRMEKRGYVEFLSSSYLRGLTFNNCVVLIEEFENYSFSELDTIITRIGHNSRVIICGDFDQSDLINSKEKLGSHKFFEIIGRMPEFRLVKFGTDDIVRSGLVKSYLIQKYEMLSD